MLSASKTADAITTRQLLDRGGHENNPLFGPHPSPAKQSLINLGFFAAQAGVFHLTERNRHAWVRWAGRVWLGHVVVEHSRVAACNAGINVQAVPDQIPTSIGRRSTTGYRALGELLSEGKIERVGKGGQGDVYRYLREAKPAKTRRAKHISRTKQTSALLQNEVDCPRCGCPLQKREPERKWQWHFEREECWLAFEFVVERHWHWPDEADNPKGRKARFICHVVMLKPGRTPNPYPWRFRGSDPQGQSLGTGGSRRHLPSLLSSCRQ